MITVETNVTAEAAVGESTTATALGGQSSQPVDGCSSTSTTTRLPINAVRPPTAMRIAARRVRCPSGYARIRATNAMKARFEKTNPIVNTHELFDSVSAA